jgi:hypothetical protein
MAESRSSDGFIAIVAHFCPRASDYSQQSQDSAIDPEWATLWAQFNFHLAPRFP